MASIGPTIPHPTTTISHLSIVLPSVFLSCFSSPRGFQAARFFRDAFSRVTSHVVTNPTVYSACGWQRSLGP